MLISVGVPPSLPPPSPNNLRVLINSCPPKTILRIWDLFISFIHKGSFHFFYSIIFSDLEISGAKLSNKPYPQNNMQKLNNLGQTCCCWRVAAAAQGVGVRNLGLPRDKLFINQNHQINCRILNNFAQTFY